jgi:superfamily II DNA/RNA helicase
LVATDLASRGLDTLSVDHVIMFDFPETPADFLHRAGRTARNNSSGTVTSFVTKYDKNLAFAIQVTRVVSSLLNQVGSHPKK